MNIFSKGEIKEKQELFRKKREAVGKEYNFDWHKMFMTDQKHKRLREFCRYFL